MSNINFDLQLELIINWKKYVMEDGSLIKKEPPHYEVPSLKGIHSKVIGKNINEVQLNTLEYILYNLHDADCNLIEETAMALFYYYLHRIRSTFKLKKVYNNLIEHYNIIHEQEPCHIDDAACVYLLQINIGSKKLYKVGKSTDLKSRYYNLISDIKANYPLVSVNVNVLNQYNTNEIDYIEKKILDLISLKHKNTKFFFEGHTESFESEEIVNIYNSCLNLLKSNW